MDAASPTAYGQTVLGAAPPFVNPACPWLPPVGQVLDHRVTRRHGSLRGQAFYQDALRYAQSLWMSGKPAQALLQLDKAWMWVPQDDEIPFPTPTPIHEPYHALVWIVAASHTGNRGYLGNPVRHFQHLASRMSGPGATLRSWRAWGCMHLAEQLLPAGDFPRDGRQICREGLWIPGWRCSLAALARLGWPNEAHLAESAAFTPCDFTFP